MTKLEQSAQFDEVLNEADAWEEYRKFCENENYVESAEAATYVELDEWYDYITSAEFRESAKRAVRRDIARLDIMARFEAEGIPTICEE